LRARGILIRASGNKQQGTDELCAFAVEQSIEVHPAASRGAASVGTQGGAADDRCREWHGGRCEDVQQLYGAASLWKHRRLVTVAGRTIKVHNVATLEALVIRVALQRCDELLGGTLCE
jgi:hypothetical protein